MQPVRNVVIVGRDTDGWITALGLARALPSLRIRLVELPSLLDTADLLVGRPSVTALHRMLGISDAELIQQAGAVPVQGDRFVGWRPAGADFRIGYDVRGAAIDDVDFVQHWAAARRSGLGVPLQAFSLAAASAEHGRIARGDDPSDGLRATIGWHIDARRYSTFLKALALRAGVEPTPAHQVNLRHDGDTITAINADGMGEMFGDLFIDASGADASLISALDVEPVKPVSTGLGIDTLLTASLPPVRPLPAETRIVAFADGWAALYALPDRSALIAALSVKDDVSGVVARLQAACGFKLSGDVTATPLRPALRSSPWSGNCVAIGASAGALDPLAGVPLHMVQVALSTLVSLWPVSTLSMPEAGEFNRIVASHRAPLLDLQSAHYRLAGRTDPIWQEATASPSTASLDHRLELFQARGIVPDIENDSVSAAAWAAIFAGHGIVPVDHDVRVDLIPEEDRIAAFRQLLHRIATRVRAAPTVEEAMAAMTKTAS